MESLVHKAQSCLTINPDQSSLNPVDNLSSIEPNLGVSIALNSSGCPEPSHNDKPLYSRPPDPSVGLICTSSLRSCETPSSLSPANEWSPGQPNPIAGFHCNSSHNRVGITLSSSGYLESHNDKPLPNPSDGLHCTSSLRSSKTPSSLSPSNECNPGQPNPFALLDSAAIHHATIQLPLVYHSPRRIPPPF